jgi:hypothetical protein
MALRFLGLLFDAPTRVQVGIQDHVHIQDVINSALIQKVVHLLTPELFTGHNPPNYPLLFDVSG